MLCNENGEMMVDFIGRFENLADDFAYVCNYLNLQATMPFLNKSQHRSYQSYYNDNTRDLIAEHCQKDIALFGYEFESYQNNASYLQRNNFTHANTR
jgi:hypothetical protein